MTNAATLLPSINVDSLWRQDFPALAGKMNNQALVYLDSAASAQKPHAVIQAMSRHMTHGYANIHRGLYEYSSTLTSQYEAVREKVASFIGATSLNEIIFTRNTTEGINLVAQSWGCTNINPGDEIVITTMEHHANIVPWQLVAAERGANIKIWPITNDGTLDIAQLPTLINARTKILSLAHVSNVLGTVNDIKSIIRAARAINPNIIVLVDGSQAVVHGPVNVTDLDADFYAFTGHKLYGPTGVGVLYGKQSILQSMPPFMGGGDMIERVSFAGTTYRDPPYRFEAGTPAIIEVIGLGAAIDYLNNIGRINIQAHEHALTAYLGDALRKVPGIHILGPRDRIGLFAFYSDWAHPSDIAMILDQSGIAVRTGHHCAMPLHDHLGLTGTVRVSLGLYNNADDVDRFISALTKAKEMLS